MGYGYPTSPHCLDMFLTCQPEDKRGIFHISIYVRSNSYLVGGFKYVFSIQLGISSSQLTNSIVFQRGRSTTNQLCDIYNPII